MKYVFLYTNIGPHMWAWLEALDEPDETCVIELCGSQEIYKWQRMNSKGVKHFVVEPELELSQIDTKTSLVKIERILKEVAPEVLLSCRYDLPIVRSTVWMAKNFGAKNVLMSDSWVGVKPRSMIKEMAKSWLLRRMYDAALVSGSRSREYLTGLGFKPKQIWTGINVVDNEFFAAGSRCGELSESLSLPPMYYLAVARLSSEKNLGTLLIAHSKYRNAGGHYDLVLAGTGPEEAKLRLLAKKLLITESVHFRGWVDYAQLPRFYAHAKAVILPSIEEPWGLAINEALACSKPVIVSELCGCVPELVRRGVNGFIFDPRDPNQLTDQMLRLQSATLAHSFGAASASIITPYSLQNRAAAIKDCVHSLLTTQWTPTRQFLPSRI
jgi:glycosyltransferase involved in cell wall biosynthesis